MKRSETASHRDLFQGGVSSMSLRRTFEVSYLTPQKKLELRMHMLTYA